MKSPHTAVGIYIFAGGFTLGVKRAGFRVIAQLEDGPYGVATTERNHPGLAVFSDREHWPLEELATTPGGVDFIYGNPPCAPFSNAGISPKKVGMMSDWWKRDPRASCVTRMFHALEVIQPKVWAWESVQPALTRGRELVDELTVVARAHGYAASYVLINALDLGVAQIRRRFFCVFHRVAIDWDYPAPEERGVPTVLTAWGPILSGEVVDESPDPGSPRGPNESHRVLLPMVPQGGSVRRIWEQQHPPETRTLNANGTVAGRPRFLDVRLAWDRPSGTMTGGRTKIHPELHRYVTLLEQQLLCGYPPDYVFVGKTLDDRYAQTAQAVMPPVGEWLARNVLRAVERDTSVDPREVRTVDLERGARTSLTIGPPPASTFHRDAFATSFPHDPPEEEAPVSVPLNDPPPPPPPPVAELVANAHTFAGPTALARAMIAAGADDATIMTATRSAFGPGAVRTLKFTPHDLKRLRTRVAGATAT